MINYPVGARTTTSPVGSDSKMTSYPGYQGYQGYQGHYGSLMQFFIDNPYHPPVVYGPRPVLIIRRRGN